MGHPSGTVRKQLSACAANFVPVSGPETDALASSAPFLQKGSIPGALYGLAADTPTIGPTAIVMTSANENAKAVAAFAQATIAQISDLRTKHPRLAGLTLEEMTGGNFRVPLHPAAIQVYKDLGLLK
jgi:TRAP-type uncharacterized transport system substrate-binding protein